jgi:ribonucleotide monophosphatase NagD (HAD superfamily)
MKDLHGKDVNYIQYGKPEGLTFDFAEKILQDQAKK